jgi:hypothetical protein
MTAVGTADWVHWWSSNLLRLDRKLGVKPQIGVVSILRRSIIRPTSVAPMQVSWQDGSPRRSVTKLTTAIYVSGIKNGFTLSFAASQATHTLRLYLGAAYARAEFDASLTDGSARPYRDITVDSPRGNTEVVYTITYHATKPGQHLIVRWQEILDHRRGAVFLQAAALQ